MSSVTEQIKERIDIVTFIGEYIRILPSGSNYKALCPFHTEKTASLMISPSLGRFKCFGCNKGGDVFTFLQEYEGIEFFEALKILAERAGVAIPRFDKQKQDFKNSLYDIVKTGAEFYHSALLKEGDLAIFARNYLYKRGVDDLTRDVFGLGLTSNAWDNLYQFLKQKGIRDDALVKTGLVILGPRGYMDRFRERLMFPIGDVYGRIIGFGGRILKEGGKEAKYINTPETELYDKSKVLYGLDEAKESIREQRLAVLVEGYMDVIASHQAGVKNVVAVSGTALTGDQLLFLKRFTDTIALAFDMDEAGIQAALRAYLLSSQLGMNTKIVHLPQAKDPDELIRIDKQAWIQAIEKSEYVLDYYFKIILRDKNPRVLEDKKIIRDKLLPWILAVEDMVERAHYLEKLALLIGVSVSDLLKSAKESSVSPVSKSLVYTLKTKKQSAQIVRRSFLLNEVEHLLALMCKYGDVVSYDGTLPALSFKDTALSRLYKDIRENYNKRSFNKDTISGLREVHADIIDDLLLLGDKDYSTLETPAIQAEFNRLLNSINQEAVQRLRAKIIQKLRFAEDAGDVPTILELSQKLDNLDKYGAKIS